MTLNNLLEICPFPSTFTTTALCLALKKKRGFYLEYPNDFLTEFSAHGFMGGIVTQISSVPHFMTL